jgi:hypothetical protein
MLIINQKIDQTITISGNLISGCRCKVKSEALAKASEIILALEAGVISEDQTKNAIEQIEQLLKLYGEAQISSCGSSKQDCCGKCNGHCSGGGQNG